MKTIQITAKCSDLFSASLVQDGKVLGNYDGYVPDFMPGQHYGDYVELTIDVETGKILNWKKPSVAQLKTVFGATFSMPKIKRERPFRKFVTAKGYTYETNMRVRVGSLVELPTVHFLRDVQGDTYTDKVARLTSDFEGICKRVISVKKY